MSAAETLNLVKPHSWACSELRRPEIQSAVSPWKWIKWASKSVFIIETCSTVVYRMKTVEDFKIISCNAYLSKKNQCHINANRTQIVGPLHTRWSIPLTPSLTMTDDQQRWEIQFWESGSEQYLYRCLSLQENKGYRICWGCLGPFGILQCKYQSFSYFSYYTPANLPNYYILAPKYTEQPWWFSAG